MIAVCFAEDRRVPEALRVGPGGFSCGSRKIVASRKLFGAITRKLSATRQLSVVRTPSFRDPAAARRRAPTQAGTKASSPPGDSSPASSCARRGVSGRPPVPGRSLPPRISARTAPPGTPSPGVSSLPPNSDFPTSDFPTCDFPTCDFPTSDFPPSDFPTCDFPISNFPECVFPISDFPNSVIPLRLVEQPVEPWRAEAGHRPVEAFHPPGPEVEVDRADRRLDRAPQRPAVLAYKAEQHGPGDLVAQRTAVVLGD